MKKEWKSVLLALSALAILALSSVLIACPFFGYNIFDRSGWKSGDDGALRYLDQKGRPLLGWQEVEGLTYYFSPRADGAMCVGWLKTEEGCYYLDERGQKTMGWATLWGGRYYFAPDGRMHTGWLEQEGARYYLNEDGSVHTGWLEQEGTRYYLNEDGSVYAGWLEQEGTRYYLNEDGSAYTGWLEQEGTRYYLNEDGSMHTGWLEQGEDRFYLLQDGSMAVGRVEIDGVVRHFTSAGKYFVVVNPWHTVPEDYAPELVWFEGFQVDASCYSALEDLRRACLAAGLSFDLTSAYRGVSYQTTLFQRKVDKLMAQGYSYSSAYSETSRSIAIPGTSEHHLGLAVDIKSGEGTYRWLAQHSWEYGFIQRYPSGATSLTGIYYEPWHYRYVGKELAEELFELGLCLEAYVDMLTDEEP